MKSAETLLAMDRCERLAAWSQSWQVPAIHPTEVLKAAVDAGLLTDEDDPGQLAGDMVMTEAAERTLDIEGSQYSCAMNLAALADIIVTAIRASGGPWARPADLVGKTMTWESGAFLEPSGLRLRRVVLVSRWNSERFLAETNSWKCLGEVSIYQMPMTMTVVLIGQRRDGRHHSPWSKGWLHPQSRTLRIRKRSGEFDGKWIECWRETSDFNKEFWIEQLRQDYVLNDVLFEKQIKVPEQGVMAKIRHLAEKKLQRLAKMTETPEPTLSACFWPTPCKFAKGACWQFREPSERTGFVRISGSDCVAVPKA